jgi:hypothetical protein
MSEKVNRPDPDSVTRTNTEVESRGAESSPRPAPPEDTQRTNTEIESRTAEEKNPSRPPEPPDTPRG